MDLSSLHYINGKSLWDIFGMVIESGSDDFLKYPARKPTITHDWGDANGIDVDLSRVFFEEKTISLRVSLIANTESDFWAKHYGFLAEWAQPGTADWTVSEFRKTFKVFYKESSEFTRFTRIKVEGVNKVACKFTLTLVEQEPQLGENGNLQVFIVDEAGRFIVT